MPHRYQLMIATEAIRQDDGVLRVGATPTANKLWDDETALHNLTDEDLHIAENTVSELIRTLQRRVIERG